LRNASYVERDRVRAIDPGALDFDVGNDVLGPDDSEEDGDVDTSVGSRGRQNALRILKARSELPSEGMWRSLAT